ncbi:hypothetical protein QQF64_030768 [Cirrhinus molitorella]|uniref:Secreted protein n=1 Tax=Cirrhinus molitorella TaxID=172907 RepID=A0ABR3N4M5_9TELE
MAPVCLASRLSLHLIWILFSICCFCCLSVIEMWPTTYVYDRQMLLDIGISSTHRGFDVTWFSAAPFFFLEKHPRASTPVAFGFHPQETPQETR